MVKKQISLEDYLLCVEFAAKTIQSNAQHYRTRNQTNISKILQDIIQGKVAEIAVYYWLQDRGNKLLQPDFDLHHKKTYEPDIECNGQRLHVKSMSKYRADKYGKSWLFQKNDPLTTNPQYNDYIVLCIVDDLTVDIVACEKVRTSIFTTPILEKLKENKLAIYIQ